MTNATQRTLFIVLAGIVIMILGACGDDAASEPIIESVWARPGETGDNSAGYMEIQNDGDADLTLTGADGDVARVVEVHESRMEDGMMEMGEAEEVAVPAGESVQLEPGGFHIMLMDLSRDLEPGDEFNLVLQFDELDDIEVEVTVEDQ